MFNRTKKLFLYLLVSILAIPSFAFPLSACNDTTTEINDTPKTEDTSIISNVQDTTDTNDTLDGDNYSIIEVPSDPQPVYYMRMRVLDLQTNTKVDDNLTFHIRVSGGTNTTYLVKRVCTTVEVINTQYNDNDHIEVLSADSQIAHSKEMTLEEYYDSPNVNDYEITIPRDKLYDIGSFEIKVEVVGKHFDGYINEAAEDQAKRWYGKECTYTQYYEIVDGEIKLGKGIIIQAVAE